MKVESNFFFEDISTYVSNNPKYNICDQNGAWEEKRSLGPTSIWHPANDKLTGSEIYGDVDTEYCPTIDPLLIKCMSSLDITNIQRFAVYEGDCPDANILGAIP